MNQSIILQIQKYIREILRDQPPNPFETFIQKCQDFYNLPASSIQELKEKQNTKIKGDIFEHFCLLFLQNNNQYKNVWLLPDTPPEILQKLSLKSKDMGIDLIAEHISGKFDAIQAKYRKKNKYKAKTVLSWKTLSTFYALVNRSGPWRKHVVITNADYIRHVGKRTMYDKSICIGTLKKIKSEVWLGMADIQGHTITEEKIKHKKVDIDLVRSKRLAFLDRLV